MSGFPTYQAELDFQILLQLTDEELQNMCQTNSYLNTICRDDYFWQLRSEKYLWQFLHLRELFSSWFEFYHEIFYNSLYLVFYAEDSYLYTSIQAAYSELASNVPIPKLEDADQLVNVDFVPEVPFEIYFLINNHPVHVKDSRYLLLSLSDEIFVKPNLFLYPLLKSKHNFTFAMNIFEDNWPSLPSTILRLNRPTQETFEKLAESATSLFNGYFEIPNVNSQDIGAIFWHLYDNAFAVADKPVIFIDKIDREFKAAFLPESYHQSIAYTNPRILREMYPEIKDKLFWQPLDLLWNLDVSNYNPF